MQAIIFAAGRGTRLKEITQTIPKALVQIKGRPILKYILESLPEQISSVRIVVDHFREMIAEEAGNSFKDRPINYVHQGEMKGTAGALWSVEEYFKDGQPVLILHGDNIYDKAELTALVNSGISMGLHSDSIEKGDYLTIELDEKGNLKNYRKPLPGENTVIATGAYVLDKKIFDYPPVQLKSGEYGLPHTIFLMAQDYPVKGVFMKKWHSINHPEDIVNTENHFTK